MHASVCLSVCLSVCQFIPFVAILAFLNSRMFAASFVFEKGPFQNKKYFPEPCLLHTSYLNILDAMNKSNHRNVPVSTVHLYISSKKFDPILPSPFFEIQTSMKMTPKPIPVAPTVHFLRRGSQPIASIVDASTSKLCFTTDFYREWQRLPSTMPSSAKRALKWLKHRKWQILHQYSLSFTVLKPPQVVHCWA